jgi:hypothetical protein
MAVTNIVTRLIKDLAVTTAKLADGAVSLVKLGALTTKGDLLTYSTTHARLGVGSDAQVLTADSTQTTGVKWGTPFSSTNHVVGETPTGTVDGVNAAFTLANTPVAGTVQVYVNGVRMKSAAGNDYTISGTTITFLTGAIPQTGDAILCDYLK